MIDRRFSGAPPSPAPTRNVAGAVLRSDARRPAPDLHVSFLLDGGHLVQTAEGLFSGVKIVPDTFTLENYQSVLSRTSCASTFATAW